MAGMPTRLSELTILVISHMGLLLVSPVMLSLFGLGFLIFSKKPGHCIFVATLFIFVLIVQWHITMTAFQTPFMDYAMSGGRPK